MISLLHLLITATLLGLGLLALALAYRQLVVTKGPKNWPLLGATLEFVSCADHYFDWITGYARRFGTFEMALFPGRRLIYTTDHANLEYFLKTNFSNYWVGQMGHDIRKVFLGEGILNVDGEKWKQQRKTISFEFASKVLRRHSLQIFRKNAINLAAILSHKIKSDQNLVDMSELLKILSFETIYEIVCGVEMGTLSTALTHATNIPFLEAFESANMIVGMRFWNPFWRIKEWMNIGTERKLKRDVQVLNELTKGLIQQKKRREHLSQEENAEHFDVLSRALTLNHEGTVKFSEKRLRDMIFNLVLAGGDTVSVTMSWFFFALSQHPEVERKVLQEINVMWPKSVDDATAFRLKDDGHISARGSFKEWLDSSARLIDYESLASMHYLHAALCETIRLYPAVPESGRIAIANDVLPDGTLVKKGDTLLYPTYAMGRMEHLWGMDALLFKPERWINKDGVFQPQAPYKFSAFHGGPRMCPGKDFALLQMKMTAVILLKVFTFQLSRNHAVKYSNALTFAMEHGLHMYVKYA